VLEGLRDELVALAPAADVAGDGDRLAPGRGADLGRRRRAGVELAGGDDHVGARLGQGLHDRPADAARSPGDDGHLAGQVMKCCEGSHQAIVSRPTARVVFPFLETVDIVTRVTAAALTPSWHAEHAQERPAIVMGGTGETVSYAQLDERSSRRPGRLRAL
jgi:hypothetical protein